MNARTTRAGLGLMAAGAVAALTLAHAPAAYADESGYLSDLTDAGFVVYDTRQALGTGYAICSMLNHANGLQVAQYVFAHTTWTDVPDMNTAGTWVIVAAINLCPWHYHPEGQQVDAPTAPSPAGTQPDGPLQRAV